MNKNQLATTVAIVTGALSPATAYAAKPNQHHHKLTAHERRLNHATARDAAALIRRVLFGPVNNQGGDSVAKTADGQKIDTRTVTVGASNPSGTGAGEYAFSITAPLSCDGDFEYGKASAVVIAEGEQLGLGYSLTPYASEIYIKNERTGAWAVRGDYMQWKTIGTSTIEAAVKPALHEAHLTRYKLGAFTQEAAEIVFMAENQQPVALMQPAFEQPAHTWINPLK